LSIVPARCGPNAALWTASNAVRAARRRRERLDPRFPRAVEAAVEKREA